MWVISSRYHLNITHISSRYHPHIIQISPTYHPYDMWVISSSYHPHINHISSTYHPHIIQISPTYHPDITHISYIPDNFKPLWIYSQAQLYWFFLLDQMWGWTAMEDYSQESFQGSKLPILHKGCSYGFSLIPLTWKQYEMKEHREQSPIL